MASGVPAAGQNRRRRVQAACEGLGGGRCGAPPTPPHPRGGEEMGDQGQERGHPRWPAGLGLRRLGGASGCCVVWSAPPIPPQAHQRSCGAAGFMSRALWKARRGAPRQRDPPARLPSPRGLTAGRCRCSPPIVNVLEQPRLVVCASVVYLGCRSMLVLVVGGSCARRCCRATRVGIVGIGQVCGDRCRARGRVYRDPRATRAVSVFAATRIVRGSAWRGGVRIERDAPRRGRADPRVGSPTSGGAPAARRMTCDMTSS